MIKINFKKYKIRVYTDPMSFSKAPEKPWGLIPSDAIFEEFTIDHMTGYAIADSMIIRLLVHPGCNFRDVLALVSHETGHKIEGGFKKNPPDAERYRQRHEDKAEHYENFALDAYDISVLVFDAVCKK